MNSDSQPRVPSLRELYWVDFTIRRSATAIMMGGLLSAGVWWMAETAAPVVPPNEPPIEIVYGPWVAAAGIGLAVLAGIVLLRRYLLVKEILRHGVSITGIVETADRFDTNTHSDTGTLKTTPTYAYYVTVRYTVDGFEQKVRVKLPHSPGTYGLKQDGDADLLVLNSMPHKPLIRPLYLGRTGR